MFFCLGKRLNTPKNLHQLYNRLRIFFLTGTCRMSYTQWTTFTQLSGRPSRVCLLTPLLPAWNLAKCCGPRQLQSPFQVYTWQKAQCGEQNCRFMGCTIIQDVLKIAGQLFDSFSIGSSKPTNLRLTASYKNFHSLKTDTTVSIEFSGEKYTKQDWFFSWF